MGMGAIGRLIFEGLACCALCHQLPPGVCRSGSFESRSAVHLPLVTLAQAMANNAQLHFNVLVPASIACIAQRRPAVPPLAVLNLQAIVRACS
jgi:hypothetical protein